MPRRREWLRIRIALVLQAIARYELQGNRPAADALRTLLRQYRVSVDEAEIQRIITTLIS